MKIVRPRVGLTYKTDLRQDVVRRLPDSILTHRISTGYNCRVSLPAFGGFETPICFRYESVSVGAVREPPLRDVNDNYDTNSICLFQHAPCRWIGFFATNLSHRRAVGRQMLTPSAVLPNPGFRVKARR